MRYSPTLIPLLATVILSAPPARAVDPPGCPSQGPVFRELAEHDPYYAGICHALPGGTGCGRAAPPSAVPGSTLAQEVQLQATVPDGFTATSVMWRAEWQPSPGVFVPLWEHRSTAGGSLGSGATVTFGAPGLVDNASHHFRVSFCDGQRCLCWSDRSAEVETEPFASLGPAAPVARIVEDHFGRPPTTSRCDSPAGDGLGPDAVWDDCDPRSAAIHVVVGPGADAAVATPTAVMRYAGQRIRSQGDPWGPDSYAEGRVRGDRSQGNVNGLYNLFAFTRGHTFDDDGGRVEKSFAVRLVNLSMGCAEPTLLVVKMPDEFSLATCPLGGLPDADIGKVCASAPPLDVEDTQNPGRSEPVWLRVEAMDGGGSTAQAAGPLPGCSLSPWPSILRSP